MSDKTLICSQLEQINFYSKLLVMLANKQIQGVKISKRGIVMKKTLTALCIICLWTSLAMGETVYKPTEALPITKVVLYKHGLGYFEREGKVQGNALLSFAFREDQMKDILTSFFAVDLGSGRISSIRYETRDPLAKQLQDVLIKVPEEAALSQFMLQLRGAVLTVKVSGETIEGRVLGIEPITEIINNISLTKGYRLVLLTAKGLIRSVDLFAVSEFSLTDESLQKELVKFLDATLAGKRGDSKKLAVSATGEGERKLRIGYLVGMPIWKCTYRVIFDEKKKESPSLLQGWALAENNTEDDWKDVNIAFVAGNPISYIMDLYSPYYVKRAHVRIPGFQNLGVDWSKMSSPDLADESTAIREKHAPYQLTKNLQASPSSPIPGRSPAIRKRDQTGVAGVSAMGSTGANAIEKEETRSSAELLANSYADETYAAKVGDLFSYEPKEKISIPRGQAAMVSILSERIAGKRILYYKADFAPKPVNAFVLQNATGLTLEAGPITFFEGSASLGEGILTRTLPPGSQEVIPYAIDVSVDIVAQEKARKEPHIKARIVDGVLTLTSMEKLTNSWKITNRGKEPETLWLHQPKSPGYKLNNPEKALKEVDNHYRFETLLKAGETVDFVVEEKRDVSETVQLAKCNEEQIRFYLSQPSLSKGARNFMKELGDIMAKKASLQREATELTQQSKRLSDEQTRIRANLQAVTSNQPKEQELRAKWVSALATNENQLSNCRAKLDEAGSQVMKLEETLAKKVKDYRDE